jgi:hypothetical protein
MNLEDLNARLRRSIKRPGEEDVSEEDLTQYINEGYRDLCGRYAHHMTRKICTFLTVAGHAKYQLPDDCASVMWMRDQTHGNKLWKKGDRSRADQRVPIFEHWPRKYLRARNYVYLIPTPIEDGYVIEFQYIAIPALLALPADVPVLPVTWHMGIVLRARWYYFIDRGDIAQQNAALNTYTVWVSDKPSEIEEETVDIDSGVELPELHYPVSGSGSRRWDDGLFDFKD